MTETRTATQPSEAERLYRERAQSAKQEVSELERRERTIGNVRLAIFLVGIAAAWLVFDLESLPKSVLLIPIAAFAGLVVVHGRVIAQRTLSERVLAFYEHGLARIDGTWTERGQLGERFIDSSHPYTSDLDIFGRGSLFQLLCTARSASGLGTLAFWLSEPADPGEIQARQEAVEELRNDIDRRERLATTGDDVAAEIDPDYLASWSTRAMSADLSTMRPLGLALVAATATTFLLQGLGLISPNVFLAALGLQAAFGARRREANQEVIRSLELAAGELRALAQLLELIESSEFRTPRLRELRGSLDVEGVCASQRIAKLHKLIQLLDARRNILFAPISIFFLWTSHTCMAIEAWRAANGSELTRWLEAVGDYESLCAISGFAYERRTTSFPEVTGPTTHFEATDLKHPLMAEHTCIANSLSLHGQAAEEGAPNDALFVVSGSNMSGKSTLLRTIGTNAVLAQMGAPVCAEKLRMSPLRIGTSMRTQDSLIDGTSRFYAEIKRLKRIVDLAGGQPPLLFLLDEVLHGTNSHDRRIGAEAVVTTLVQRGSIGLITTHDLTLAEVAENLGPLARNVHFADQLVDGQMVFDYTMHEGPVRGSNALGLMRAIGLEV